MLNVQFQMESLNINGELNNTIDTHVKYHVSDSCTSDKKDDTNMISELECAAYFKSEIETEISKANMDSSQYQLHQSLPEISVAAASEDAENIRKATSSATEEQKSEEEASTCEVSLLVEKENSDSSTLDSAREHSTVSSMNLSASTEYLGSVSNIDGPLCSIDDVANVVVVVRVRPVVMDGMYSTQVMGDKMVKLHKPGSTKAVLKSQMPGTYEYMFDFAFGPEAKQCEVYSNSVSPLIERLYEGVNATVFAYGATGSGKTHTMLGSENDPGIILRAITQVLQVRDSKKDQLESCKAFFSYMEVYNETIIDLLDPHKKNCEIMESGTEVHVSNLMSKEVNTIEDALALISYGSKKKKIEATSANSVSSRSHTILQITITSESLSLNGTIKKLKSKLSLVDLAGSERARNTLNSGVRLKEGSFINQSLLALANCINALSVRGDKVGGRNRVKYRDSKLTHLLKNSLEGNCLLVMIANVHPSISSYNESSNTLKYANRAKEMKVNTVMRSIEVECTDTVKLQKIIESLRNQNEKYQQEVEYLKQNNNPTSGPSTSTKVNVMERPIVCEKATNTTSNLFFNLSALSNGIETGNLKNSKKRSNSSICSIGNPIRRLPFEYIQSLQLNYSCYENAAYSNFNPFKRQKSENTDANLPDTPVNSQKCLSSLDSEKSDMNKVIVQNGKTASTKQLLQAISMRDEEIRVLRATIQKMTVAQTEQQIVKSAHSRNRRNVYLPSMNCLNKENAALNVCTRLPYIPTCNSSVTNYQSLKRNGLHLKKAVSQKVDLVTKRFASTSLVDKHKTKSPSSIGSASTFRTVQARVPLPKRAPTTRKNMNLAAFKTGPLRCVAQQEKILSHEMRTPLKKSQLCSSYQPIKVRSSASKNTICSRVPTDVTKTSTLVPSKSLYKTRCASSIVPKSRVTISATQTADANHIEGVKANPIPKSSRLEKCSKQMSKLSSIPNLANYNQFNRHNSLSLKSQKYSSKYQDTLSSPKNSEITKQNNAKPTHSNKLKPIKKLVNTLIPSKQIIKESEASQASKEGNVIKSNTCVGLPLQKKRDHTVGNSRLSNFVSRLNSRTAKNAKLSNENTTEVLASSLDVSVNRDTTSEQPSENSQNTLHEDTGQLVPPSQSSVLRRKNFAYKIKAKEAENQSTPKFTLPMEQIKKSKVIQSAASARSLTQTTHSYQLRPRVQCKVAVT